MSYSNYQIEALFPNSAIVSSAGAVFLAPGFSPIVVRAVAFVVTTKLTVAPGVITINKRPAAGTTAGETLVGTLTVPIAADPGDVIYLDGLDTKLSPGEELELDGNGGATAGAGHLAVFYQPQWESPANNTKMSASA